MSTDISMYTRTYQVGNRQWLLSEPDVKFNVTLDITKFTAGTHYPNGYIPSGTVIGKVTASGLYGPYTPGASDGTQTAAFITYDDTRAVRLDGTTATQVGNAGVSYDCAVSLSKLPFQSGAGSIDSAGQTALRNINFQA